MSNDRRRTYETWRDMHRRCNDPRNKGYTNYGGRGIAVCERWSSFELFLSDMGVRHPHMTIERVDVNQGYDPFNCVWATRADNNRNTRKNLASRERRIANPPIEPWERAAVKTIARVKQSEKLPYKPQEPVHGSKKMYSKHKCRCDLCVASFRKRRKQKPSYSSPARLEQKAAWLREYRRQKRNACNSLQPPQPLDPRRPSGDFTTI